MRRRLLILEWFTVILASAAILMFTEVPVCAQSQTWPEPMLDGVTYSDMAQWSSTYGGGAFYGGAPMPQAGFCYPGPQDYIGPPPPAKKKARRRRK
jgi:hypothetical protein